MVYLAVAALALVIAGIAGIFILGSRVVALTNARYTASDVENALTEVASPDAETHDTFDLFLQWPIGDPYLEAIRQRCLQIVKNDHAPPAGHDLSPGAVREVRALLSELRSKAPGNQVRN